MAVIQGSIKLTDFLLLCVLKSRFFFYRKGSPPRMVEIHGKWSRLSNTDSIHFGKLGCKRTYIEYGGDTGFHQRKGRFPLSNRIQESKIVGWGKTKKVFTCCLVTKSKTGRVSKLTDFLLLCVLKSRFFFLPQRVPPRRKGRFPLSNRIQESKIVGWGKTKKVFTCCLVTKSKTGRVSKLTDFLLLCVLKSRFFFYRKGLVEIHGKWSRLSNTDSIHFANAHT